MSQSQLGARLSAAAAAADLEFVKGLGAEQAIDYAHDRFEDHVRDVDVVIDLVGGTTQSRSWSVLKLGGILVTTSTPPDQQEAARHDARELYFIVEPDQNALRSIAELVDNGRLRPGCTACCPSLRRAQVTKRSRRAKAAVRSSFTSPTSASRSRCAGKA